MEGITRGDGVHDLKPWMVSVLMYILYPGRARSTQKRDGGESQESHGSK